MQYAEQLNMLGTETAFAVSAQAKAWADKGHKVYPFHLGDINMATPENIVEATLKGIRDGKTGYCPSEGILPLREALANDVGLRRGLTYSPDNVSIQPGGKPTIGKFIAAIMNPGDEVLYPNPGYPIYESQIEYQGGCAVAYNFVKTDTGFDIDIDSKKSRQAIGIVPQELNFDVFFSIGELLELQAGYYGYSHKEAKERTTIMLEQFGLTEKRKSRSRELSGGMKRRVQIAKALVHDPKIVILDEPTAGVDIELRHMLWDLSLIHI